MKATLEFNLPDENSEYRTAFHAPGMFCVLWDFDQWLREQIKYHDKPYEDIRKKLWECLENNRVSLENM